VRIYIKIKTIFYIALKDKKIKKSKIKNQKLKNHG